MLQVIVRDVPLDMRLRMQRIPTVGYSVSCQIYFNISKKTRKIFLNDKIILLFYSVPRTRNKYNDGLELLINQ